jgi:hypothetical protein
MVDTLYMSSKQKILLLFLNILFISILALLLPVRFEENDDVMMLLFSSGAYTGQPENILVFINSIYGSFLQLLYTFYPIIEWYTLLFLIFHIIFITILSYEIISKNLSKIAKVVFLLVLYLFEIRLLFQLQFTTTSALLALAGLILITKKQKLYIFVGAILFTIATLIRFEAAFLVFLIFIPQLYKTFFYHNYRIIYLKLLFLGLLICIPIALKYIDYLYKNQSSEWSYYNSYNKVRGKINDNPNFSKTVFDFTEIDKNDLFLLESFFPDGTKMNLTKLNQVLNAIDDTSFSSKLANIYPSLRQYTLIVLFFSIVVFLLLISINTINGLFLFLHFGLFIASISYVSMNATLNYRVFLSALITLFYFITIYSNLIQFKINKYLIYCILLCFFMLFSNRSFKLWEQKQNWAKSKLPTQKILIDKLFSSNHTEIPKLFIFPSDFSVEIFNAFEISSYFRDKKIIYAGWTTNIPYSLYYKSHLDLVNIPILVTKENYRLKMPVLVQSIESNYNIKVKLEVVSELNDYMIVEIIDR